MYVAILPRKVVGVIFCFIGALLMFAGILGNTSRNGGPVISILLGSLFAGLGWLAIKSSGSRPHGSLPEQRESTMARSASPALIPPVSSSRVDNASGIGHWTRTPPAQTGWYWYRSTWEGKQDSPELIYCNAAESQSGEPEFITAAAYNLFPEDFTKMNTEFWTEQVMPPPTAIGPDSRSVSLIAKHEPTHEELMNLVARSSKRELTDEEMNILASRLCWRDEATREQWYREQGIDPTDDTTTAK